MANDEEREIWSHNAEDYSLSVTVVPFEPPLPLLRGPVPAGAADDPAAGPFVLAFKDAEAWRSAYRTTEAKVLEQCEAGARVGCSITASNKCKLSWWKSLFGAAAADFEERERCEEREMAACVAASRGACIQFAKEKCLPAFRDARIMLSNSLLDTGSVDSKENDQQLATTYRGSILLQRSIC